MNDAGRISGSGSSSEYSYTTRGIAVHLPTDDENDEESSQQQPQQQSLCNAYASDGFVILPNVLDSTAVEALNERLEHVLRGTYDRGEKPDKTPKLIKLGMMSQSEQKQQEQEQEQQQQEQSGEHTANTNNNTHTQQQRRRRRKRPGGRIGPLGFTGSTQNAKVLQIINVHKSDNLFRQLVTDPGLGRIVAKLAGWKHGARLAQDQVWAKPPGSPPLTYHRDSPYFMFEPPDVVTVWIALDDMVDELGPLVYVRGSHRWGDGRVGSAGTFFQRDGGVSLLKSAAEREGIANFEEEVEFVSTSGLAAGGISIHDGRTWHGSGGNCSDCKPRRGLGLHFVPAEVKFTEEAVKSRLWGRYLHVNDDEQNPSLLTAACDIELPEKDFPIVWRP